MTAAKRQRMSVSEQYELGLKYMNRGMYTKALEQLNKVRNYHRDDPHAVKAELAIGDVFYKKREWTLARQAYTDFLACIRDIRTSTTWPTAWGWPASSRPLSMWVGIRLTRPMLQRRGPASESDSQRVSTSTRSSRSSRSAESDWP